MKGWKIAGIIISALAALIAAAKYAFKFIENIGDLRKAQTA